MKEDIVKTGVQTVRPLALSIMLTMLLTEGVLSSRVATAATYYVATAGNNANSGTQAQPFRTIAKGLTVLQAGDTLYLRGGPYTENIDSNEQTIPSGTSWSNAITIAAYPGETVILNGHINFVTSPCGSGSIAYLIFDRLIIDATGHFGGVGGCGDNAHHIRYQNGELKNSRGSGMLGIGTGSEIINMKVHHNGSSWLDHGIYWCESDTIIRDSEFYENTGYGIHLYGGDRCGNNVKIYNNRIYNNHYAGVTLNHGTNILFYNNLVYNHTQPDGWALQIDRGTTNAQVYNNTLHNNLNGVQVWRVTNTIVKNNILSQSGNISDSSTGLVQSNNLTTDPKFVNASANDFTLQAMSPAIDAGTTLSAVTTDIVGTLRSQSCCYDIGAYEYQGVQLALPSPRNLKAVIP